MATSRTKRRLGIALGALVVLLLLAIVLPLVNVNRYSRRIATSISNSIGRPVHLDNISLGIFPLPGFTIQNFVVSEDPHFGDEPVMRANVVHAYLRWSSLWRGKVEFSTISLEEPSVNLVRDASGHWNLESILTRAAQIDSAPTEQKRAGPAPRFPYIEATDGRINFKIGQEKTPFSMTAAEFALWLPNPQEWRLRIKAHPARTDTDAYDTGEIRVEATLRKAAAMHDVPVQMEANWRDVPLGEGSKVLLRSDEGWRGTASLEMRMDGTLGDASLTSDLHLHDIRRADFVPARQMDLDTHCEARATGIAQQLRGLRCSIQADAGTRPATPQQPTLAVPPGTIALTGDVPDIANWGSADLRVSLTSVAPGYALDWARLFSRRIPANLKAAGAVDGTFSHGPSTQDTWAGALRCPCTLQSGDNTATAVPLQVNALVDSDGTGGRAVDITLLNAAPADGKPVTHRATGASANILINGDAFRLHTPNAAGAGFLQQLGNAFPPLLDGMPQICTTQACTLERHWADSTPVWAETVPAKSTKRK